MKYNDGNTLSVITRNGCDDEQKKSIQNKSIPCGERKQYGLLDWSGAILLDVSSAQYNEIPLYVFAENELF